MIKVAGFDCSSKNIACVILNEDKKLIKSGFFESKLKSVDLRLVQLIERLDYNAVFLFFKCEVNYVTIESPIYIQNAKAALGISQIIGGVKAICARYGIPFISVDNKVWKAGTIGHGNATKEEIMKFAIDNWGRENMCNQDICDAACISLYGILNYKKAINFKKWRLI